MPNQIYLPKDFDEMCQMGILRKTWPFGNPGPFLSGEKVFPALPRKTFVKKEREKSSLLGST